MATLALGACGGESDDDRAADDLEAALDEAADEMADVDTTEHHGGRALGGRAGGRRPRPPPETIYAHATWTVTDVAFQGAGWTSSGPRRTRRR